MAHVRTTEKDGIARVILTAKTMPPAFFTEFREAVEGFAVRDDIRVLLVETDNPHFSYGLDLMAAMSEYAELFMGGGLAEPRTRLRRLITELQASFSALDACPFPTVAVLQGWCIGGALDLATACDIRIASLDTKISLRETKLAIVADLGTLQRLPAIVGEGNARLMAFTGRDIDARKAIRMGLLSEVYDTHEELRAAAQALAEEIAANAPLTVRGTKHILNYGRDHSVQSGLDYVATWNAAYFQSEDLGEAAQAFFEKRPATFKGR